MTVPNTPNVPHMNLPPGPPAQPTPETQPPPQPPALRRERLIASAGAAATPSQVGGGAASIDRRLVTWPSAANTAATPTVDGPVEETRPPTLERIPEPHARDLTTFVDKFEQPEYTPPEYAQDSAVPGSVRPADGGEFPPPRPGSERAILRPERVTASNDWTHDNPKLELEATDQLGQRVAVPWEKQRNLPEGLGMRKIAVDIAVDQTDSYGEPFEEGQIRSAQITAVHGVEPLYRGEDIDTAAPPTEDVLVEGKVVDYRDSVDPTGIYVSTTGDPTRARPPLPMMKLDINPDKPGTTLWVAAINVENRTDTLAHHTVPRVGDTVQTRVTSPFKVKVVPGDEDYSRVAAAHAQAGGYYSGDPGALITEAGEQRQAEATEVAARTETAVDAIQTASTPGEVAQAAGSYLQDTYRVDTGYYTVGAVQKTASLTASPAQLERIVAAVGDQPAADIPVAVNAMHDRGNGVRRAVELEADPRWQALRPEKPILGMTTGEFVATTGRLVDEQLLNQEPDPNTFDGPPALPLYDIFKLAGKQGTAQIVDTITDRLGASPRHQLFDTAGGAIIAKTLQNAPGSSGYNLLQMTCDAAQTPEEVTALDRNNVLPHALRIAGHAMRMSRTPEYSDGYRLRLSAAKAVQNMLIRTGVPDNLNASDAATARRILNFQFEDTFEEANEA